MSEEFDPFALGGYSEAAPLGPAARPPVSPVSSEIGRYLTNNLDDNLKIQRVKRLIEVMWATRAEKEKE